MPMIEVSEKECADREQVRVLEKVLEAAERGDAAEVERWSRRLAPPADVLRIAKEVKGAEWVRSAPFDTSRAEAEYGRDWLDR